MKPFNSVLQGLMLFLLLLLMGAADAYTGTGEKRWNGEGTNPHLESIFLGRCNEYISVVKPELSEKNCSAIWEAFKSVLHKDPCSVLPSDYDLFINLSRHSIPRDKSLFWENSYSLVIAYADNTRRLMSLNDMLYGRVGDLISWCREENGTDFDYQSCPIVEDCENNAVDSFWKRASSQYAHDSSGVIHVMLNGSELSGAYPVKGFFADYEIPNFQKDKITQFEIWIMHEIGGPYIPVKLLQCVDHTADSDCVSTSAAESIQQRFPSLFGGKWDLGLVFFLVLALASGIQL
ncbi:ADP-ribosyl cyclase/cyclic ADP-ribose hydrolase 2 isoform X2 [Dromiciops gliroides]|uniref:ADP-ribosyl cyclase/cyclic ADP-ribose hydrolase 2 isoform X2 n=1 Tax=Dromiciops gliroides TaxID=33562 RepID=UPI001CC6D3AC|nr:ADP-ribosyl cyclase/cyclic ADP-ribose hydrolase 2 isoform X2 [Dromiciops gliroides]